MEKKTKKTAIKSKTVKSPVKSNKKTTSKKENTVKAVKSESNDSIKNKITKLETAYMAALSGKIKFGEVKSIFKQIHKEIKENNKK